jgi:hypothetical protein
MWAHGLPEKSTMEQSGRTTAAITHFQKLPKTALVIWQSQYLIHRVEQAQRAGKRSVRPLWGFTSLWAAAVRSPGLQSGTRFAKGNYCPPKRGPHASRAV